MNITMDIPLSLYSLTSDLIFFFDFFFIHNLKIAKKIKNYNEPFGLQNITGYPRRIIWDVAYGNETLEVKMSLLDVNPVPTCRFCYMVNMYFLTLLLKNNEITVLNYCKITAWLSTYKS